MNTPAIQEGGCTQFPRLPPGKDQEPDLEAIPISGAALVSGVGLLAGVLAGVLQVIDTAGSGGTIIAIVALFMGVAGSIKSRTRLERALGIVACVTAMVVLGLVVLR